MNNDQPDNPGDTEFVLPIVCTHCGKEISLAMIFALLPPEVQKEVQKLPVEEPEHDPTTEED